jgi:hypothetical protein
MFILDRIILFHNRIHLWGLKHRNETSGSIKHREIFDSFFFCRSRTALHLAGYNDNHCRSFRLGLAKVKTKDGHAIF